MSIATHRTLQDRLSQARTRSFQGRRAELQRLQGMLDPASERRVAFVHGPGGVGKTTLLRELEMRCIEKGVRCVRVDARDLDPTPDALRRAIDRELGVGPNEDVTRE